MYIYYTTCRISRAGIQQDIICKCLLFERAPRSDFFCRLTQNFVSSVLTVSRQSLFWDLVRPPPTLRQNQKFWLKKSSAPFESYSVCWQSFAWSRVWDMKSTSNNSDRSLTSAKCAEKKFEFDSRYV